MAERDPVRYPERSQSLLLDPPPALTSDRYAKAYIEVMTVGSLTSTERPQDRADVVRLREFTSPTLAFNQAARQVAERKGIRCPRMPGLWP